MEDGDGEDGPGTLSGGTGLGDGDGQKDVSDKIENQDQLDDATKPGEEKKDENRDCKEEEKGVNMTDDFDSHLQDVEKKEGEDSDEEEDENDADKQMGETDNAADKLDQQIWGSEDEDDIDEEQSGKEKDEKGKGESTGEKEMAAKEEEQGTDDGSQEKERKKQKEINEINEPEVDNDHIDPYHNNPQPLPEPEDFDLPENMDVDEDIGDDLDGETETENPFEIDVTKDDIPQDEDEPDKDKEKTEEDKNKGLEVSSDEEDEGDNTNVDQENVEQDGQKTEEEEGADLEKNIDDDVDDHEDNSEDNPEDKPEENPEDKPEENPEHKDEEPKKPQITDEEEENEEKRQEPNPQATPSSNDPSAEDKVENADMDVGTDDNVENTEQQNNEDTTPFEQGQEQVGDDRQRSGRSELDKSDKGHRGEKQAASSADRSIEEQKKYENKPGQTDQDRILGEVNDTKRKATKTLNVEREEEDVDDGGEDDEDNTEREADAYQHVKQAKKDDLQALDSATKEQADQQPVLQRDEEENAEKMKEDEELAMEVDDDDNLQDEKSEELKPEKMKDGTEKERKKVGNKADVGEEQTAEGVEVEGENVLTTNVERGRDTTYHTKLQESALDIEEAVPVQQYMEFREWLSRSGPAGANGGSSAAAAWRALWNRSSGEARALCERLRLVLEPTGRARLTGDFRTGRAINMRRVIPYIASHFRKDRIWLRRTKPAKREYKIAVAVDDSSSMADNRSKELAFESLALVSQALNLLESGDLAVLSFGETPKLLHSFSEQFSEHSGSKILEQLRFEQTKTRIAQLLNFSSVMFEEQAIRSDAMNAKLLIVVSDGRGIFSEGETKVWQAVRRARQNGIFLVYVIIDNPDNKDSIMDIRRPLLDPVTNNLTGFVPYLDTFPFPYYLILRDMSALPNVLGDAMRQWFELAANVHS